MVESSEAILKAANSLMKRLPPKQVGKNLTGVVKLVEDENIQQDLLDKIHQPLSK